MLRIILVVIGALCIALALYLLAVAPSAAFGPLIFGTLLILGTVFEQHYRPRPREEGSGWQATGEKFVDPGTGKVVEVRYNPKTGERDYRDVP